MSEGARESLLEPVDSMGARVSATDNRLATVAAITVQAYPDFDALPPSVAEFFAAAGERNFFMGAAWFRIVLRTAGSPIDRPRIYIASRAGKTLAALVVREREKAGPLKLRVISSPSRGLDAALYGPLLDPEQGEAGLRAIVESISRGPTPVHVVRLECFDPESRDYRLLVDALRACRLRVKTFPDGFRTYSEAFAEPTVAQYLADRSPEMRAFIQSQTLSFSEGGRGQFVVVTGGQDLGPALVDYALIDLQSWKEQEFFPDCVPQLAQSAARIGALRLVLLYIDGRPAAAQIWIVSGGRATMWRSHFARQFAALSIGTVITFEAIRYILETDRPRVVEFGPGTDTGRDQWLQRGCQRIGFVAFNLRTMKGWGAAIRHHLGLMARSTLQFVRERLGRLLDRS